MIGSPMASHPPRTRTPGVSEGCRRRPSHVRIHGDGELSPTYFLDLMDDDIVSDGSSIGDVGPSHRLSRECAMADALGQPPVVAKSL